MLVTVVALRATKLIDLITGNSIPDTKGLPGGLTIRLRYIDRGGHEHTTAQAFFRLRRKIGAS
ncbi:hypothetical protein D9M71_740320 [compost metagenome]